MIDGLEIAREALAVAGDDAEAVVLSERSGLARFAAREVHQPTLVDNTVVVLRSFAAARSASPPTNRIDAAGLPRWPRARRGRRERRPAPEFAGSRGPTEPPSVARLRRGDLRRSDPTSRPSARQRAIAAVGALGTYGFFTSGE